MTQPGHSRPGDKLLAFLEALRKYPGRSGTYAVCQER